jgi:peptidoglycan/xylan/chitin deacetylase (PgdA/CDA1 family)
MESQNAVPTLVISLDFELFWGVADSKTIDGYGKNIEGVWEAVPAMLALFRRYDVHVTWATVGMLMCKDFKHWNELRPSQIATYERESLSAYSLAGLAQEFPKLFFGRPLVEQILSTDGQELASHSYSHFYSGENGANIKSFVADMDCNRIIFDELGVQPTSFVFPRNQVREEYLSALSAAGFTAYRGNQEHRLYRHGSSAPRGSCGRFMRFADDYLPLTGSHAFKLRTDMRTSGLLNVPASRFFRPSRGVAAIDRFHLWRVKGGMLDAARTGGIFHLWWHPHNFGSKTEINLKNLESILRYYSSLNQLYGMRSLSMSELAQQCL